MGESAGRLLGALIAVTQGRLSLQLVMAASLALFWIAFVLFLYMVVFRSYQRLRVWYRAGRRRLYEPAIEKVLMEEPVEAVTAALRPRRWGDTGVVQEVIIDSMRYLKGTPFDTLRAAAHTLGLVERNLKRLGSRDKHRRGAAMETLGVLRAPQAVVGLIAIMNHEPMHMKLVALRSLAAIGDAAALPYFVEAADRLSPAMLPRLASLMLEFGPPAQPWVQKLITQHRESFPPRVLADLLKEVASDGPAGGLR